ncbi:hypothetical protein BKA57DRAFT_210620 [Linnemannia elongata]|nr:hypothetical protein BKA57DRAFT_210620 [Linnemannia elongata]
MRWVGVCRDVSMELCCLSTWFSGHPHLFLILSPVQLTHTRLTHIFSFPFANISFNFCSFLMRNILSEKIMIGMNHTDSYFSLCLFCLFVCLFVCL